MKIKKGWVNGDFTRQMASVYGSTYRLSNNFLAKYLNIDERTLSSDIKNPITNTPKRAEDELVQLFIEEGFKDREEIEIFVKRYQPETVPGFSDIVEPMIYRINAKYGVSISDLVGRNIKYYRAREGRNIELPRYKRLQELDGLDAKTFTEEDIRNLKDEFSRYKKTDNISDIIQDLLYLRSNDHTQNNYANQLFESALEKKTRAISVEKADMIRKKAQGLKLVKLLNEQSRRKEIKEYGFRPDSLYAKKDIGDPTTFIKSFKNANAKTEIPYSDNKQEEKPYGERKEAMKEQLRNQGNMLASDLYQYLKNKFSSREMTDFMTRHTIKKYIHVDPKHAITYFDSGIKNEIADFLAKLSEKEEIID